MRTIECYRWEAPNGIGMFTNEEYLDNYPMKLYRLINRHGMFNTPYEDGICTTLMGQEWFCAYKSLEQARKFVLPDEAVVLSNNGYRAYLFEVSQWQEGRDQYMFTREGVVSKIDVTEKFLS